MKAKYLKVGDRVEVVTPKEFIRCGYPLTIRDILETRSEIIEKIAFDAAVAIGLAKKTLPIFSWGGVSDESYKSELAWKTLRLAVAQKIISDENFGGNERIVVEAENERLAHIHVGKQYKWVIVDKKFVRTGVHETDWDYDEFSERRYISGNHLSNIKQYCVYDIECESCSMHYRILSMHVKRVDDQVHNS